ncbi:hypothetical protein X551_00192 [Methylibium sp. T29]|nr:hypothetical protein X551_00192 [Methylibium sp. T29]EWS62258.1 hypothetical protein Y694_00101 [Methylibium sp. T29-B]
MSLAVEIERALDADQDVVGRAQPHRAAPDDAGAGALHRASHGGDVEIDRGEHLHRVGGAGRGCDRARRCLGHRQPAGGDDRHDEQRRAVAGQAADAMLVDDQVAAPVEAFAHVDHRPCQRYGLVEVEVVAGTGGDEGRQVQVRVAACGDVADHGAECAIVESVAIHLRANMAQRFEDRGVRDLQRFARQRMQCRPRRLRQAGHAMSEPGAVHDTERGHDAGRAGAQFDARLRREALGAADGAIAPHVDHRLLVGVDARAPGAQRVLDGVDVTGLRMRAHDSSTVSR